MFRIDQPCQKQWSDLPGDDTRRYCDHCGQHVHNLAAYNEREQRELGQVPGRVCVMLGLPRLPRRAVFLGGLLTALRPLWAETVSLRVRITDATGEGIRSAEIRILDDTGKVLTTDKTGDSGKAELTGLPKREGLRLEAHSMGFKTSRVSLRLEEGQTSVDVQLEVGSVGGGIYIEPHRSPI